MLRIDSHMHYMGDNPESRQLLENLDLKMLNICVAEDSNGKWRDQADCYAQLAREYPNRFVWCTSFDLPRFEDPGYVDAVIAGLEADFAAGAIACKIWKNFGMGVRKPNGDHMLPDDPMLEPIYAFLAASDKTLLMHIADPLDGWLPLREGSPHYSYFSAHPEWHLYGRTDYPSHEQLIAARDAVVASHPNLRVVGAHLGSLEHDVDEVAVRLERYPNFAVDMSARLLDLAIQDTQKVHAFFLKYADRVLFGADMGTWGLASAKSPEQLAGTIKYMTDAYEEHFNYLERSETITVQERQVKGIGLPEPVLEKVYRANARRWYPGM